MSRASKQLLDAATQAARDAALDRSADLRFGIVEAVDTVAGTIDVALGGATLYDIPYMGTPVLAGPAWLLHQGSTMICIGPGVAGGGTFAMGQWKYQTGTGQPSAGYLRHETGTLTLTEVDTNGYTQAAGLAIVTATTTITARDTNGELWFLDVTGTPTDNGTWWSIPVTVTSGTEPPKNNQNILLTFFNASGGAGASTLDGLTDVTITSPADGAVLTYDTGTSQWIDAAPAGGGATGAGGDQVFYENDTTVTADYAITTGKNAVTAGPVTVNSGVTVTVPSGSTWVVV